jgi:hypothetical protein
VTKTTINVFKVFLAVNEMGMNFAGQQTLDEAGKLCQAQTL